MSVIENVSRREFFGAVFSAGAFVLVARVMPESASAQDTASGSHIPYLGLAVTIGSLDLHLPIILKIVECGLAS